MEADVHSDGTSIDGAGKSAATGSAATGSAATGSAATGSAATSSAATGDAGTGSAATSSAATGSADEQTRPDRTAAAAPPRLSQATLARAHTSAPEYDRTGLVPGIVHFGMGGFHRAHQAAAIDALLRRGEAREWAIMGVGVRHSDDWKRAVLSSQDGLFTLVEKQADGTFDARVIGSILGVMTVAEDGTGAVLDLMAAPTTRIVSLTITEGGYNINQATGEFLLDTPEVAADLSPDAVPSTVFGLLVEALRRRREAGTPAFTVMSCDNLPGNGEITRSAVLSFARAKDPALADWIAAEARFPDSMVDRITPVPADEDTALVADLTGLEDAWPVMSEPFFQWVQQDDFADGRPPLEAAGVEMVADVEPYELMKLRLLNLSHQALCYFSYLLGYRVVSDAMSDPLITGFLRRYMREDALPTMRPLAGVDPARYSETCIERFSNPQVKDTIPRLCAESSDRIPKWIVPLVQERTDAGGSVECAAAIVASWARYATGVDEQGAPIEVVDGRREQVMAAAASADPLDFLRDRELFADLAERTAFTEPYLRALASLRENGARAFLTDFLA